MSRPSDRTRPTVRDRVDPQRALAEQIRALGKTPAQLRAWAEQNDVPRPRVGVDDLVVAAYIEAHPTTAGARRARSAAATEQLALTGTVTSNPVSVKVTPDPTPKSSRTTIAVPIDGADEHDMAALGGVVLWPHPNRSPVLDHPSAFEAFADEPPTDAPSASGPASGQIPSPSSTSTSTASGADTPSTSTTSTADAASPSAPATSSTAPASTTSAPAADLTDESPRHLTLVQAKALAIQAATNAQARRTAVVDAEHDRDSHLTGVTPIPVDTTQALAAARRLGATGVPVRRLVARLTELGEHLDATVTATRWTCRVCQRPVTGTHVAETGIPVHGDPVTRSGCHATPTRKKTA